MAAKKLPAFEDEARYSVTFAAAAEYKDTRFKPRHAYVIKGKVAKAVKAAISEAVAVSG